ncbi:nitrate reductase (NADH) [Fusarium oxysporum f. sp. pisi HDV247]|uniref:Nitrate reductase [NADPH] n=1 Tax=Fusarium oxysporum f. sp. pisi HDV247 TaxID=1080344 RepID=W9NF44_FUSOX|nr:nitrate reductase (NADH) [Fusarium oxysporum f. sp. pisi HDV247]
MPPQGWVVKVKHHPGASLEEVQGEPEWEAGHNHHVGLKNQEGRRPGYAGEEFGLEELDGDIRDAREKFHRLQEKATKDELVNFRDIVQGIKDFHLIHPEKRSIGWRHMLECTEDWVKYGQDWPANAKKKEEAHVGQREQREEMNYGSTQDEGEQGKNDEYNAEQTALLKQLQDERDYIASLEVNDGNGRSPQRNNRSDIAIDQADQFTPDNWFPRRRDLIRLTGKSPLNAEPPLTLLLEAGLITPNDLHYVRNHGPVPHLLWEFHEIDIDNGKLVVSMDNLKEDFNSINIPIAMACDGNRRGELNMVKRSKGFNWGPAAVGCAYWKGPLVRDILVRAGVSEAPKDRTKRYWVNFQGADDLSEGKYETSIPFEYAMDPANDVILAFEMNDEPLPPDHGYPVRLMIPGYVGGRNVKWLSKIWISDAENDSYYHIWDNRVVPGFVRDIDDEFAETMFRHPNTACNEQNLNSVIVRPAGQERIAVSEMRKGGAYRIMGYAYDGGGHLVERVEVSLDEGDTWIYCARAFPLAPIRHGNKFWTWLHWHVDVPLIRLLNAKSIVVRCFNVFKNTQPQMPNWNLMGMMNNGWYRVTAEIVNLDSCNEPHVLFRHPVEPAGPGGWMKPSVENEMEDVKRESMVAPQKQFTREEIEKHDKEYDCWIVVRGNVYDATSVLSWHPGGMAPVMGHAGRVHQETTNEFESIHDDFAHFKLKECLIGTVTDKAKSFIKENAEKAAKERAERNCTGKVVALRKRFWMPAKLIDRHPISEDTRFYTFELPEGKKVLGLGTCQHVELGFHLKDRMVTRPYTPVRPILPPQHEKNRRPHDNITGGKFHDLHDGTGTFDLIIKTYFPSQDQPGGAMSNILDTIPLGEEVEMRGPLGNIVYHGSGSFTIDSESFSFNRISLVLGGSGITPGYALLAHIMLTRSTDRTPIRVLDANKSQSDILLRSEMEAFEQDSEGQLQVAHVLNDAGEDWAGERGLVTADMLRKYLFEPGEGSVVFLCGPPALIKKTVLPALTEWGYKEDKNLFGF